MTRNCVKWPLDLFLKENKDSLSPLNLREVELYFDEKNEKEIRNFVEKPEHKKRLRIILIHILQHKYNNEVYRREPGKDLTAMKFGGGSSNPRIYCKEFFDIKGKKIVMAFLLNNKDFQKAGSKKIKEKLKIISDYEYDFK